MITLTDIKEFLKIATATTTWDTVLTGFINTAKRKIENYCDRDLVYKTYTYYIDGDGTDEIRLKCLPIKSITSLKYYDSVDETYDDIIDGTGDTIANTAEFADDYIILRKGYVFTSGKKNIQVVVTAGYKCITGTGTISASISSPNFTGVSTLFTTEATVGDVLQSEGQNLTLLTITDATHVITSENTSAAISAKSYVLKDVPDDLKEVMLEMVAILFDDSAQGKGRLRIASENVGSQASQSFTFKEMDEKWGECLNKYRRVSIG